MGRVKMTSRRLLIVPDVHSPFHNKQSWAVMMATARFWKPKTIILLGDLIDFYCLSAHGGSNPNRSLLIEAELDPAKALLAELDSLGADKKIYIAGNHEYRLNRYLSDHAPKLYNQFKLEKQLDLKNSNWQFIPYMQMYDSGKVLYTHDLGNSGAYAVHQALPKAQHSVVIGHIHRMDYIIASDIRGRGRIAMCPGWLGNPDHIDYEHSLLAKTQWSQGFALAEEWPDGITTFIPIPIINGKVHFMGKVFTA